jgi:hypothetical protein
LVKQIEEICIEEAKLREKRLELMYPEGEPLRIDGTGNRAGGLTATRCLGRMRFAKNNVVHLSENRCKVFQA